MKQLFTLHTKLIAWGFVVIVAALAVWYIASNTEPALGSYTPSRGNVIESLDEPATVAAERSANISFQESGRITHVYVHEGETIGTGAPLADLDTASLETNVEQANASLAAAEAKLAALEAGATSQAIAVSEATLDSARQALTNTYSSIPSAFSDAYGKANDAVRTQLNPFFSNGDGGAPQLTFATDLQTTVNIENERRDAGSELNAWKNELNAVDSSSTTNAALEAAVESGINHLSAVKQFLVTAGQALVSQSGLSGSAVSSYGAAVTVALNEVNASITNLNGISQDIASEEAAVATGEANLNLTMASSTPQIIQEQEAVVAEAEAAVSAAKVALNNASLGAPFPGTVQNLTAEVGEVVSPTIPLLSLVNSNGLKIQTYVSELDIAKIKNGDAANVTLDAFGPGMKFPATVTAIDTAETYVQGIPSYLVTLHFTSLEPEVRAGMTGNVHLILAEDDNVIAVPSRLILNDGNENFVLVKTLQRTKRQPVEVGLVGDNDMTEITSGVGEGDTLVNF